MVVKLQMSSIPKVGRLIVSTGIVSAFKIMLQRMFPKLAPK